MNVTVKTIALVVVCSLVSSVGAVALYSKLYHPEQGLGNVDAEGKTVSGKVFKQPQMSAVAYSSANTPDDFVEVAARSRGGVVNIRAVLRSVDSQSGRGIDPFEFFFGPRGGFRGQPSYRNTPTVSIGSGVIISSDGYIITNNHVIENATKISVTTNDNREFVATIVGSDPTTDLALLKVDADNLTPIPFGNSEHLKVGEWVLAIGNPFNLSSTVTAGIVSAKGRSWMGEGGQKIASFIQTDAAVNPGNSGGALVNTKGELVGINTMIFSQTGNYAGYSFAIPVSIASKVVSDLKEYGTVQRAVLGISGLDINSQVTEQFGLKVSEGAVAVDFTPISSAHEAGVKSGDVITSVNGIAIRNMAELQEQISKYRPGDRVTLEIDRKGTAMKISIELKNANGTTAIVHNNTDAQSLGISLVALSAKTRQALGIDYGVQVTSVKNGPFRAYGIRENFIILSINGTNVSTVQGVDDLIRQVVSSSPDKVLFIKGFYPNGRVRYIAVDLS